MKKNSGTVLFVGLISLLFWLSVSEADEIRGVTDTTIKIGVLADFTGPTPATGMAASAAYSVFFADLNNRGGINGRKVELLFEDSKHEVAAEVAAYRKLLYQDQPLTIFSFSTAAQPALFSTYEKERVPTFAQSTAHMMGVPLKKYVFSAVTDYYYTTFILIDYILKVNKDARIGIAYVDDAYGNEALQSAEKRLSKYGKELVSKTVVTYAPVDTTTQVLTLKKAKADYVIVMGVGGTIATMMRDAERQGYQAIWAGAGQSLNCIDPVNERTPDLAKNVILVGNMALWNEDCPGINKAKAAYEKYNKDPITLYGVFTQDWVQASIVTEAIRRCGKNVTPERLRDEIEATKNFDTGGITAPISFSPTEHIGNKSGRIYKWNETKKEWNNVTDWLNVKD